MLLNREEQDAQFRDVISHYATISCKICHGTGKSHWIEYMGDMHLAQYEVCQCVTNNIQKIKDAEEVVN